MSALIINGHHLAQPIYDEVRQRIEKAVQKGWRKPKLTVLQVSEVGASMAYVRAKQQACIKLGITCECLSFPATCMPQTLQQVIEQQNQDVSTDAILLQLPLPTHFPLLQFQELIRLEKDVDGFHPYHLGRLCQKAPLLRPCTPAGIVHVLQCIGWEKGAGKTAVIVGTSAIVGRPMFLELLLLGYTITVAHSQTGSLEECVKQADLLIVAVGKPHLIQGDWIKPGACVIDVGITRTATGKLVGDVDFEAALPRVSCITPVPGGVGPLTVAMLMRNVMSAYEQQRMAECAV